MNILNIIDKIEQVNPEMDNGMNTRREALKGLTKFGSKVAIASLPFALGAIFNKAYADATLPIVQDLLDLENLQANFYTQGLAKLSISGTEADLLRKIYMQDREHAIFWKNVIIASGRTPAAERQYDFTAQGLFPNVFNAYPCFLQIAQVLKDASAGLYKAYFRGRFGKGPQDTYSYKDALTIEFVEARHSAYLRILRKNNNFNIQPWITGTNDSGVSAADEVYTNENQTIQELSSYQDPGRPKIQIIGVNGHTEIDTDAATQAFDEAMYAIDHTINFVSKFYK